MSAGKLTRAQWGLLNAIEHVGMPVADHYEPAKKLVAMGLAYWSAGEYLDYLRITEAGRKDLEAGRG